MKRDAEFEALLGSIARFVTACVNSVNPHLDAEEPARRTKQHLSAVIECHYFVLHLANRIALMNCDPQLPGSTRMGAEARAEAFQ